VAAGARAAETELLDHLEQEFPLDHVLVTSVHSSKTEHNAVNQTSIAPVYVAMLEWAFLILNVKPASRKTKIKSSVKSVIIHVATW